MNYFCMDCVFDFLSTKLMSFPRSTVFSSMISSKNFIVMCFTFKIYFELIFVKGVRSVFRLIFLHVDA